MVSEDEFGEADTKSTITGTISSIDEDSVKIRKEVMVKEKNLILLQR